MISQLYRIVNQMGWIITIRQSYSKGNCKDHAGSLATTVSAEASLCRALQASLRISPDKQILAPLSRLRVWVRRHARPA